MALPGRVRVLRTLLLVVWIAFLPAWLVAMNLGVQPTAILVALTFVVWVGLWAVGHFVLRRERCPVCGGALFAGEAFESLRATRCSSCEWEFGGCASSATQYEALAADGPIANGQSADGQSSDGQSSEVPISDVLIAEAAASDAPASDAIASDASTRLADAASGSGHTRGP